MADHRKIPLLLWPFWVIWLLVIKVFELTGRLVGSILGVVLMISGAVLTATIFGAIIGIPFLIFGFMLVIRSLF